nr:hypothetical protein [Dyella sp. ASV24]
MAIDVFFRFFTPCRTSACRVSESVVGYLFIPGLVLPPLLGVVFLVRLALKLIDRSSPSTYEAVLAIAHDCTVSL